MPKLSWVGALYTGDFHWICIDTSSHGGCEIAQCISEEARTPVHMHDFARVQESDSIWPRPAVAVENNKAA